MTVCTACHAAVPPHTTFFAASGEVCGPCHARQDAQDSEAFASNAQGWDAFDDDSGFDAFGESGGLHVDLSGLLGALTDNDGEPWNGREAAFIVGLVGLVGWKVATFLVPGAVGMFYVWLLLVGVPVAAHLLTNRRLSSPATFAWAGAMLTVPSLGIAAYIVKEVVQGDRQARELDDDAVLA